MDASSHNNGNVITITDSNPATRSQQFTYDQLNRLLTAETTSTYATSPADCWGEAYVYDNNTTSPGEFGNLTNINVASSAYNGCTQESLSVTALSNNQLSATGFSYDASGNLLADGTNTYGFNAESEIKSATGVNYTYDGDGNRLEKSNGKIYWYGAGTEVLDESDLSGNITDEYVFFGARRVAHNVVGTGTTTYYAEDMLGSSRLIVNSDGEVCHDSDFYPFGGERVYFDSCDQNYKFQGKERDAETGNDDFGARYYSSRFGRWLSPDWSSTPAPVPYANLTNPQTLNLYAMSRDNPETFADLNGHLLPDPDLLGGPISNDDAGCLQNRALCNSGELVAQQAQQQKPSFWQRVKAAFHSVQTARQKEAVWLAKHPEVQALIMIAAMASGGGEAAEGEGEAVAPGGEVSEPPLQLIHSPETVSGNPRLGAINSLKPGSEQPLTVKPDGRVMNGNTRISVLQERGVDVNSLPRVKIP